MATGPTSPAASAGQRMKAGLTRAVSLADDPADSDDLRLRKRVGIAIGYLAIATSLVRVIGLAAVGARDDHAQAALALARGMLRIQADARDRLGLELDVRIGLASGPVVGGVIGQKRLLFDLWGDTVNLASRMESSGVPGRIQVAPSTWALLRDTYAFEERQAVAVKGLGVMTTYLLAEPMP